MKHTHSILSFMHQRRIFCKNISTVNEARPTISPSEINDAMPYAQKMTGTRASRRIGASFSVD
jgi:hypothetical protein